MMEVESFSKDFCEKLEFHLTEVLSQLQDDSLRGFWCDGVSMPPDSELTKKKINDTRKVETVAWAGVDGQNKFKLIIHFGRFSLRRYANGKSLSDCLPDAGDIKIDLKKELIELYLK